jgi:predicted DsbA family dithiol-disulfide isomerase
MRIDIVSDAICPWCYVGKRHLEAALPVLASQGLEFTVQWHAFQLNPDMPREGADRLASRLKKFGSIERVRELEARLDQAAEAAGLAFRQDLIRRTPNTVQAHRLIWYAEQNGNQDAVVERLFAGFFVEGADIGDDATLATLAAAAGLNRADVEEFLASDRGRDEVLATDRHVRASGVSGVPSFFLEGHFLFSGALPPDAMADSLRQATKIIAERRAA